MTEARPGAAREAGGIAKRSVMIAGHRTSVSLEAEFWTALQDIARARGRSVQALIGTIDAERGGRNLSSAIRVHVLRTVQGQSEAQAHSDEVEVGSS